MSSGATQKTVDPKTHTSLGTPPEILHTHQGTLPNSIRVVVILISHGSEGNIGFILLWCMAIPHRVSHLSAIETLD
jgi:hypothetical protein